MRIVYVMPPMDPNVVGTLVVLALSYAGYLWLGSLLAGGIWVPLNPVIYIGTFLVALLLTVFLAAYAADGHGIRRWVLGTAAVAVAAGWLLFALDRSLDWQDRRDAAANYAGWEEFHSGQPPGDDADIHIDLAVLEATRRAGLGLPELPADMSRKDRNAAIRAWQRKATASAQMWRDAFMDIHFRAVWEADTRRVTPYLHFTSFFSFPTFTHRSVPGVSRAACETQACIASVDIGCSAMFGSVEANVGLRPAPTLFVNRERVLSQGSGAVASTSQPNGTLRPEGMALLRHPPRWLDQSKAVKHCRDRLNLPA